MALSRRKEITELIVSELKKINGNVSTFDPSYTYNVDIANNCIRRVKFIDEINDFPTLCVVSGVETRIYETSGLTTGELNLLIMAFVRDENPITLAENLADDIEHVIYNLGDRSDIGIMDATIENVSTDEGLATPFGTLDIDVLIRYQLNI